VDPDLGIRLTRWLEKREALDVVPVKVGKKEVYIDLLSFSHKRFSERADASARV